jgi:hypothetical protein
MELARETVHRETGILLHPEVELIGPTGRLSLDTSLEPSTAR